MNVKELMKLFEAQRIPLNAEIAVDCGQVDDPQIACGVHYDLHGRRFVFSQGREEDFARFSQAEGNWISYSYKSGEFYIEGM